MSSALSPGALDDSTDVPGTLWSSSLRCDESAPNPPPLDELVPAIEAKPPLPLPKVFEPNELDAPAAEEPKADWPNEDAKAGVEAGTAETALGSAVSEPKNVNRFEG